MKTKSYKGERWEIRKTYCDGCGHDRAIFRFRNNKQHCSNCKKEV